MCVKSSQLAGTIAISAVGISVGIATAYATYKPPAVESIITPTPTPMIAAPSVDTILITPEPSTLSATEKPTSIAKRVLPSPNATATPAAELDIAAIALIPNKTENNPDKYLSAISCYKSTVEGSSPDCKYNFNQGNSIGKLNVALKNLGTVDMKDVQLKLIADGSNLKIFTIEQIEVGKLLHLTYDVQELPRNTGKHRLEVQINPEKAPTEVRHDNNAKVIEYEYAD